MITCEQAANRARKYRTNVGYCCECEDAFVFSARGDLSYGRNQPIVVLKESGETITLVDYAELSSGRFLCEYYI